MTFGYSFALHPNLAWVRNQLRQGREGRQATITFQNTTQNRNSIVLDEKFQVMLVRFNGRRSILLPTQNVDEERYQEIVSSRLNGIGNWLGKPISKTIAAELDFLGRSNLQVQIMP